MTAPQPPVEKAPLWWSQYIVPAIGLLITGVIAAAAVLNYRVNRDASRPGREPGSTLVTSTVPTTPTPGPATTRPPGASTTSKPGAVVLGRDRPPTSSESCRLPAVASGAEWLVGSVPMGGRRFDVAHYCNLVSGGAGSLTFTLAKEFRQLKVSVGFADAGGSARHTVKFEFIGDDKDYLTETRTIRFGDIEDLTVDVSDVTRLRIQVTETGSAEGRGQTSQPVLGTPTLLPVG